MFSIGVDENKSFCFGEVIWISAVDLMKSEDRPLWVIGDCQWGSLDRSGVQCEILWKLKHEEFVLSYYL